ncbi:synaptic vesicle glycoprotein 2C-like [Meleagris gallopavo]|uniref:synaptic vesicle glycoprotein 2C-like n=1 Tax=Meleagris gallopavo TaxID=9103 RepID=UPI000549A4DB|nr:synaptic vesicle glycoprotein 2C-like [Meleagris gallopavo]
MGSAYQFHSWRVFVLVCAFPSVFAIGALTTMPESPRFYLENGKHDEAWMVLKQVHDTNMRAKGHPERVFSVRSSPPPVHPPTLVQSHQSHLDTIVPEPSAPSCSHLSHLSATSPVPMPSSLPQCHQPHLSALIPVPSIPPEYPHTSAIDPT